VGITRHIADRLALLWDDRASPSFTAPRSRQGTSLPARLENLTGRPVVLALASGEPLRLAPGAVSGPLADVEVDRSAAVADLVARGHVAVHPDRAPPARARATRARRRNANADAAKPA
jgi:hypothetical protein